MLLTNYDLGPQLGLNLLKRAELKVQPSNIAEKSTFRECFWFRSRGQTSASLRSFAGLLLSLLLCCMVGLNKGLMFVNCFRCGIVHYGNILFRNIWLNLVGSREFTVQAWNFITEPVDNRGTENGSNRVESGKKTHGKEATHNGN